MGWSTGICFQNELNTKVYWIQVWWWGRPNFLAQEMRRMALAPFLSIVGRVCWRTVLLKCERLLIEMFLSLCKCRNQICLNVRIGIDFSAFCNKNERRFPWKQRPSSWQRMVPCALKLFAVRNVYRKLCNDTIILSVKHCFDIEHFSSEKMISPVSVPDFVRKNSCFIQKNFCSSESFFFLEVCEAVASLQFDRGELQIGFNDIPHRLLTHIHFSSHFPNWPLGILSDSSRTALMTFGIWDQNQKKSINSVINSWFWCFKKLYCLWIGIAPAMKLNDSCTIIIHTSKLS